MKLNQAYVGICLFGIVFLGSCKKSAEIDYRDKYLGDFSFKVISNSWLLYQPPIKPDTQFFKGEVKTFLQDKVQENWPVVDFDQKNGSQRLVIWYLPNIQMSFLVDREGQLLKYSSGNYFIQRGLVKKDTVSFRLTNASGHGGGFSVDVVGIRVPKN